MKNFLKIVSLIMIKIILFPLRVFPIKSDRIIFSGLTGGNMYEYSGNPKYLCEYLEKNVPRRLQRIWLVKNPSRYQAQYPDILFIKHYSLKSFYYLMTTPIIVTNGSYAPWFSFRKKQRLINTWHGGGAYKRIENDKPDANKLTKKRAEFAAKNISLFVSSCKQATALLFRGAFLYQGEVLEVGMPRNDLLVRGDILEGAMRVRDYYQVAPGEKILLYAPTYRESIKDIQLDGKQLQATLSQNGEIWRILFRNHRYQVGSTSIGIVKAEYTDVSDYPDVQELLMAADMVITDYSSLIWDYSFLARPCFLYVPDVKEYVKQTGFYVEMEKWPFAMATSNEMLIDIINNYDANENEKRIKEHHELMGNCESGKACEALTEWIIKEWNK